MAHRSAAFILTILVLLLGTTAARAAPVRSEAGEPVCRDIPLRYCTAENAVQLCRRLYETVTVTVSGNTLVVTGDRRSVEALVAFSTKIDGAAEQVLLDVRLVTVNPGGAAELGLRSEVSVQSITPVSFTEAMPVGRRGLEGWDYVPMPSGHVFPTLALLEQRGLVRAGAAQRIMTQSGHGVRVTLVDESISVRLVVRPTAGVDNVAVEFGGDLSVKLTVTEDTIVLCRTRLQAPGGHWVYVAIAAKVMP